MALASTGWLWNATADIQRNEPATVVGETLNRAAGWL